MDEQRRPGAATRQFERSELPWLLASVLLVNLVGGAPAVLADPNSVWFQALSKPYLYPSGLAFGVVWTTLFTLLGVALFVVWRERHRHRGVRFALWLFVVQMVVNASWTVAFFGAKSVILGFAVIVILWVLAVATAGVFWRVRRIAGLLVVPYVLWVTFAAVVNYQFLALN